MNDFYSNALSLIKIQKENYEIICGQENESSEMKTIIGPGTGLGVYFIIYLFTFIYFYFLNI
jgi:glucokinase